MALPSDCELTKLRILAERARRDAERAEETARQQGRIADVAWMAFVRKCDSLGYCAHCEKQKEECRCVLIASNVKVTGDPPTDASKGDDA